MMDKEITNAIFVANPSNHYINLPDRRKNFKTFHEGQRNYNWLIFFHTKTHVNIFMMNVTTGLNNKYLPVEKHL